MVVGRVTNEGRRSEQAMRWSAEAHGLASAGGTPSFWVALLNNVYNFTAVNDGPNPAHTTCALIRASAGSDPIIPPTGYNGADGLGHALPWSGTQFITSVDAQNNLSLVQFAPGFDPLLTAEATLTNVAGFALCSDGALDANTKVFAIFPGGSVIASVQVGNSVRLRSMTMYASAF